MNTFLGISAQLSTTEVNENAISRSTWVYIEGYLVTSPTGQEAALETKRIAKANGTKVAVSFSDPGMVTFFRDNLDAILEGGVDFIFCNEIEALEWAGTDNLQAAAQAMRAISNEFVITLGLRVVWCLMASKCTVSMPGSSMLSTPTEPAICLRALLLLIVAWRNLDQGLRIRVACGKRGGLRAWS